MSEPVLSLINAVHYRETPRKSCLPSGKGERTSTWKLNSIERNMGVQLQMQHLCSDVVYFGLRNSLRSRARADQVQFVRTFTL